MKKFLMYGLLVTVLILSVIGCGSNPKVSGNVSTDGGVDVSVAPSGNNNNVDTAPTKITIIDWNNRTMGEDADPAWLRSFVRNKRDDIVKNTFGLSGNSVIRISQAERPNVEAARIASDLNFASQIAYELKRYVVAGTARNFDQNTMEEVEKITSTTKVTLTGGRQLPGFWQQVERNDDGVKTRSYIYWTVYVFDDSVWSQLIAKYLYDIVRQVPDSKVQQQLQGSFNEMDRQTKREEQQTDAQFNQMLNMQVKEADNKQQLEMAKINQQSVQAAALGAAARAEAEEAANARYLAYRYGDSAAVAAAAMTSADVDWVKALATYNAIK